MAHVDSARWIREHLETVVLGLRGIFHHLKGFVVCPDTLPAFFHFFEIVPFFQATLHLNAAKAVFDFTVVN
jgi:hypothetical protein